MVTRCEIERQSEPSLSDSEFDDNLKSFQLISDQIYDSRVIDALNDLKAIRSF